MGMREVLGLGGLAVALVVGVVVGTWFAVRKEHLWAMGGGLTLFVLSVWQVFALTEECGTEIEFRECMVESGVRATGVYAIWVALVASLVTFVVVDILVSRRPPKWEPEPEWGHTPTMRRRRKRGQSRRR